MKEYLTGKRYNAGLTPSLRRHWRFFVLGSTVYCLAALALLRRPVPYAGINDQVFRAAGELLIRGMGYWLFGTVSFLLGCVPLMLPILIWEWIGFRYGLIPIVNLYGSGQYVQICLLLMIRFGFVFFPVSGPASSAGRKQKRFGGNNVRSFCC